MGHVPRVSGGGAGCECHWRERCAEGRGAEEARCHWLWLGFYCLAAVVDGAGFAATRGVLTWLAAGDRASVLALEQASQDTDGVDATDLALIHTRRNRGVTLDVLNREHASAGCAQNILRRVVSLRIHEVLIPFTAW